MQRRLNFLLSILFVILAACTTSGGVKEEAGPAETEWETIKDLQQIAAIRKAVNKPHFALDHVVVLRLINDDGKRFEITSLGPSVIGFHNGGAPAARTVFSFAPERDRIILFSQDVPHWSAFRREILLEELTPGSNFRFPVVQDSGQVIPRTFSVEQVITQ